MDFADELFNRVVLTPAERMVMLEQIQTLRLAVDNLQANVEDWNSRKVGESWMEMESALTYMNGVLNTKAAAALRSMIGEGGSP